MTTNTFSRDPRWIADRASLAAVVAYVAGLLLLPPRVLLIADESRYVAEALRLAGRIAGDRLQFSDYPPGTSLLQSPFVWIAGWSAAVWASALSLVATVLIMRQLLREMDFAPGFALLIPGFFAASLYGRLGMSDMPSCALVAVSLWALWRARDRNASWSALAAFAAGLTVLFREPTVVLLGPILLGAAFRRAIHLPAAIVGGLLGVGVRLAASAAVIGDALYLRDPGYGFSLGGIVGNLPVYTLILGVAFPAGVILPFLYRGVRRAELVAGFSCYFTFFSLYEYNGIRESGLVYGLILSSRLMLETLPVLVVMAADVYPRWGARLGAQWKRAPTLLVAAYGAGAIALSLGVHYAMRRLGRSNQAIMESLQANTSSSVPVVTNHEATEKYFNPAYGERQWIRRDSVDVDGVPELLTRRGHLTLVFLDRSDSELFRGDAAANERFLVGVQRHCVLRIAFDAPLGGARLRVYDVQSCKGVANKS
jgi:4-amino-4-deoxy-L-arabinose transferase-like glycosyltransferase